MQNYRIDKYVHGGCPSCGEIGIPWWDGPNPPPHTANRGILITVCGHGWFCGGYCGLSNKPQGCGITQVFCYRCSAYTHTPTNYPATWEPAYFAPT
jgi:hypothetical protein